MHAMPFPDEELCEHDAYINECSLGALVELHGSAQRADSICVGGFLRDMAMAKSLYVFFYASSCWKG